MTGYKTRVLEALQVAGQLSQPATPRPARTCKGVNIVHHSVNVERGGTTKREKVIGIKSVTIRERIARFFFADLERYAVIVPGRSVETLTITAYKNPTVDDLAALMDSVQRHPAGSQRDAEVVAWGMVEDHADARGLHPPCPNRFSSLILRNIRTRC